MKTRQKFEKGFKELESELGAVIKTVGTHIHTPDRPISLLPLERRGLALAGDLT
jgi:hypothetical protein